MASKPFSPEVQFLADLCVAPYCPAARARLHDAFMAIEESTSAPRKRPQPQLFCFDHPAQPLDEHGRCPRCAALAGFVIEGGL